MVLAFVGLILGYAVMALFIGFLADQSVATCGDKV